jgi:tetratricopeptide (TPR) repeat protein
VNRRAELFSPYILGLLAQAHAGAERCDEALAFCEEALASGERSDVHFFDAEIHRLQGTCLLGRQNVAAAEASFERAIAVARDQGARMPELRATVALAVLYRSQGKDIAGRRLLSEAVACFADVEPASDLQEARCLLREWTNDPRAGAFGSRCK